MKQTLRVVLWVKRGVDNVLRLSRHERMRGDRVVKRWLGDKAVYEYVAVY